MSQPQQPSEERAAFRAEIIAATTRPVRKPNAPKTVTANDLTRQIIRFVRQDPDAFATRLNSTGIYRADLKKYVPSQQVAGIPDIYACVNGRAVHIEVKVGKDQTSDAQRNTIADLMRAGADVYVAKDFEGFKEWFVRWFQTPPFV